MLKLVQVVVECDSYSLGINLGTSCSGSWCVDSYSLGVKCWLKLQLMMECYSYSLGVNVEL